MGVSRSPNREMASVISQDIWKSWEKQGHSEFLKIIEGYALKEGKSVNLANDNSEGLFRALYELVWQVIKGGIKKESLFPAISQILVYHVDVASVILDVLNVIDHETLVNDNSDERQILCGVLKEFENWLGESLIKERLEIDTLQDCNLLKAKKVIQSLIGCFNLDPNRVLDIILESFECRPQLHG